jgi:hypothetical protein
MPQVMHLYLDESGTRYELMSASPFLGFACVIDRPGYNARYREKYGREQWSLCKTAFSELVERAAKYAQGAGYRLAHPPFTQ